MDKLHETLRRVEEYAERAGVTPQSVCRAATGNPRLYERLRRRRETLRETLDRLEQHMRENPVDGVGSAERHVKGRGDAGGDDQGAGVVSGPAGPGGAAVK